MRQICRGLHESTQKDTTYTKISLQQSWHIKNSRRTNMYPIFDRPMLSRTQFLVNYAILDFPKLELSLWLMCAKIGQVNLGNLVVENQSWLCWQQFTIQSIVNYSGFKLVMFCSRLELLTRSANLNRSSLFKILPFLGVFILKLAIFACHQCYGLGFWPLWVESYLFALCSLKNFPIII